MFADLSEVSFGGRKIDFSQFDFWSYEMGFDLLSRFVE